MRSSPEMPEHSSASRGSSRSGPAAGTRLRRWGVRAAVVLAAALLISAVVRLFVVDVYTISQESMVPTLHDGERVVVDKRYPGEDGVQRGDVVVFDGEGSFTPYRGGGAAERLLEQVGHWFGMSSPSGVFVKRVIGTGGDTVACCDDSGRLTVNGEPVPEDYLTEPVSASTPASELSFEAEVPPGRMWVMGDNRRASVDSRDLLGAPGGGMISEDRIIGRAVEVVWPVSDRRTVEGDGPEQRP
ncbi:signal peptidase I [Nesterenkonia sp.]|uniref:signal peptidase I n=1 Tax=Nesterenkonia sp. TaxID=704201 RepID=UPI0026018559|nr:signal peptidase I [Nesterenkonia sp.]